MRWLMAGLCVGILAAADACGPIAGAGPGTGQLVFQKDSTCTDTTNTELYVDGVSQGQFTMHAGSVTGFTVTAYTHIANAVERAGLLRAFATQAVIIPPLGQGFYVFKCNSRPPPESTSVVRPAPHSRR